MYSYTVLASAIPHYNHWDKSQSKAYATMQEQINTIIHFCQAQFQIGTI